MGEVVVGLDVGEARIGAAVGEVGRAFVFGRGVIDAKDRAEAVGKVRALAEAEGADKVVIGLPRRTEGTESRQSGRVRAFAEALADEGLDIVFEDERFTTQLAAQQVRSAGLPRGKRQQKGRLDEASAILILESYLARIARERSRAQQNPEGTSVGSSEESPTGSPTDGSQATGDLP